MISSLVNAQRIANAFDSLRQVRYLRLARSVFKPIPSSHHFLGKGNKLGCYVTGPMGLRACLFNSTTKV